MAEVASAYVSLIPSTRGFGSAVTKGVGSQTDSAGKTLGGKLGKAMAVGLSAGLAGAVGATKALYNIGSTFDDVSDTIRVGTGATGKALEGLEDSAKRVGKSIPVAFEEIGPTIADLNTRLGLTGKPLEKLTKQFLEAGRITGEALDVKTFTGAFNAFDVQAGKTSNVMDELFRVSQDTGLGMNDLAAAVARNAPNLKQFGFSIDESANLIGTLDKAGLDSNRTLATLSRAMVTFAEEGKKPQDALRKTVGQIEGFTKAGNDAAAIKLAGKIFGTRGASQFVAAVKSGKVNLDDLTGATEKNRDSILKASEDTQDFTEKWQIFKNRALARLEPVATRVFNAIGDGMDRVSRIDLGKIVKPFADGMKSARTSAKRLAASLSEIDFTKLDGKELGEKLGTAMADALNRFVSLAGKVTKSLGKMFGKVDWVGLGIDIGKQMPALLLGLAAGILNFDVESIFSGIKDHWGDILLALLAIAFAPAKIAGGLAKILAKIPFVGKFLAQAVTWLNDLGGKLLTFGGDLFKTMWRGFTGGKALPGTVLVVKILGALKSLPKRLLDFMVRLQVRLGVWALDAFEAIGKGARGALVGILRFVASIPRRILSALGGLLRLLSPKGADLMEGFLRAIRDKAGSVVGFVKTIPGKIKNQFSNAGSLLKSIGSAIIDGLVSGIKAAAHKVTSAVNAIVDKIPKFIRDKLGIRSPSKVTMYLGEMIGEGLARGVERSSKKVSEATKRLIDRLRGQLDTVKSDFASIRDSVAGAFTGNLFEATTAGGFIQGLTGTRGQLTGLLAAFKELVKDGWKPALLSQLFQSGNGALILDLAKADRATSMQAAGLLGGVNSLSMQLGTAVAQNEVGGKLDKIERQLDQIRKNTHDGPNRTGAAVGREINGAVRRGRRLARV